MFFCFVFFLNGFALYMIVADVGPAPCMLSPVNLAEDSAVSAAAAAVWYSHSLMMVLLFWFFVLPWVFILLTTACDDDDEDGGGSGGGGDLDGVIEADLFGYCLACLIFYYLKVYTTVVL